MKPKPEAFQALNLRTLNPKRLNFIVFRALLRDFKNFQKGFKSRVGFLWVGVSLPYDNPKLNPKP